MKKLAIVTDDAAVSIRGRNIVISDGDGEHRSHNVIAEMLCA